MSRLERNLLGVLILTAVVLWTAVGYNVIQAWQQPLGPQLSLPTYTPAPLSQTATDTTPPTAGPTSTPFPSPKPSITPFVQDISMPLCGGPLKMTLLAIGSDTRSPGYLYGLADVIRLVRVDFVTPRVSVLEFPRDLWVEIPEIDAHYKITHGKLNQAYLYGNPGFGYYQGLGQGPGLLARTLDLNFGARPDHYIAANMQTFVRLVDAIGGIDIYLPYDVDARKTDQGNRYDLVFRKGAHHLNGQQALMLARIRTVNTFHRADQQNRVLCAVRDTLLDAYNLPKIPDIVGAFDGAVQTDLSPQQISQLACLVPKLQPKNISFITFPRELLKETRTYDIGVQKDLFIFEADFNALRLYVNAFNAGIWPGPVLPASPSGTPLPPGEGGFNGP